jgi:DnaK suppressor protein
LTGRLAVLKVAGPFAGTDIARRRQNPVDFEFNRDCPHTRAAARVGRGTTNQLSSEVERRVNKATLKKFKTLLTDKRDEILKKAKQTLEQDMALDTDDLPDEMDLASSEYLQSFTFRLRGREKSFLDKIEKALKKIDDGTFGVCEECGEEISVKRLEARPETTLCIRCKEDQERMEKDYT